MAGRWEMDNLNYVLPVKYVSGGQMVAESGWIHSHRILDTSVLLMVQKGRFTILEDDRRIEVKEHETVILRAGCEHRGIKEEGDEPPVYCWAHFYGGEEGKKISVPQLCVDYDYCKAITYFHQLLSEARDKKHANSMVCDFLLSTVLLSLTIPLNAANEEKSLSIRMKEYINCNFMHNITLKELSQSFSYSEDYISRVFKKEAGISYREYLSLKRIDVAKELLTTTDSLQQISVACGFENVKSFMTKFKRVTGVTPTQYRNMITRIHLNSR